MKYSEMEAMEKWEQSELADEKNTGNFKIDLLSIEDLDN